jgi:hypothetical protein
MYETKNVSGTSNTWLTTTKYFPSVKYGKQDQQGKAAFNKLNYNVSSLMQRL